MVASHDFPPQILDDSFGDRRLLSELIRSEYIVGQAIPGLADPQTVVIEALSTEGRLLLERLDGDAAGRSFGARLAKAVLGAVSFVAGIVATLLGQWLSRLLHLSQ